MILDPINMVTGTAPQIVQHVMQRAFFGQLADGPAAIAFVSIPRVDSETAQVSLIRKWTEVYDTLWKALIQLFVEKTRVPLKEGQPVVQEAIFAGLSRATDLSMKLMAGDHRQAPLKEGLPADTETRLFFAIFANQKTRGIFFSIFLGKLPFDDQGMMQIKLDELEQYQLP